MAREMNQAWRIYCIICRRWKRSDHTCPKSLAHLSRPALTPERLEEMARG